MIFVRYLYDEGARLWAENNGVPICTPDELITG